MPTIPPRPPPPPPQRRLDTHLGCKWVPRICLQLVADCQPHALLSVVDGFGSGTVLVSGAAPQSEAASARIVDGGGLLVASGIDAAPGTQPPEAALSTPEPSAHEPPDALPAAGLQPAEGEAAGDDRADSGSNSLSSLPPELQRPPDTPENAELEVRQGRA